MRLLLKRIRQYGLKGFIRRYSLKFLGLLNVQEQLNTLNYFLNEYADIKKLPPTNDSDLRLLQLCDVEFLLLIKNILGKYKLKFALSYGTMLGAYRHKGFIPWDDDQDIIVNRDTYDAIDREAIPEFMEYGIEVTHHFDRLGLSIDHERTGIWIDVYPIDTFYVNASSRKEAESILKSRIQDYRHKLYLSGFKDNQSKLKEYRNNLFSDFSNGAYAFVAQYIESTEKRGYLFDYEHIYPFNELYFENYEFSTPNNAEKYLENCYGDYLSFPRWGILHHGGYGDRAPLSQWANIHNVDMREILNKLKNINQNFVK